VSTTVDERLYPLLPAVYRVRDAENREALRALLGVIETELEAIEADVEALYDNWFVETCAEWVVPYLGDLLGVRGLVPLEGAPFTQRGLVANTISYRRAKGTAAVLEALARDVTGWSARAVEFFQLLTTTQQVNHVRRDSLATVDLRDANALELVSGPFEQATHTLDVRHIDSGRGRYDIPNVGIFLWRLESYAVQRSTAFRLAAGDGRFTFDPLGRDVPLFNQPLAEPPLVQRVGEANVSAPLRRRPLHDEIEALRGGASRPDGEFGTDPVLALWVGGNPVAPTDIEIADLSDPPYPLATGWRRPAATTAVAVDPVLGRIAFHPTVAPAAGAVEVSFSYGFPGDLGGGPYDRRDSLIAELPKQRAISFQRAVGPQPLPPEPPDPRIVSSVAAAIADWNTQPPGTSGVIALLDSRTYDVAGLTIELPSGSSLLIVAADWAPLDLPAGRARVEGRGLDPSTLRPCLAGDLAVHGTGPAAGEPAGPRLTLDGVLLDGQLTVATGDLHALRIAHSTLVGGLHVPPGAGAGQLNDALAVELVRAITGPVDLAPTVASLAATDTVVDGSLSATATTVAASTVLGATTARELQAENSIFTGLVRVERRQRGCVRYSYLPFQSVVPQRYRCLAADAASADRVVPEFTSTRLGSPGYAQLAVHGPAELARGAEDEREPGAFNFLQQPYRISNLQTRLDEYLRFGLEAGLIFVT
jgi:hypothetical protein